MVKNFFFGLVTNDANNMFAMKNNMLAQCRKGVRE